MTSAAPPVPAPRGIGLDRLVHELRTPLAAIQSTADALAGGHLGRMGSERHATYVQGIADTARHALAVLDAMMAHAGAEPVVAERTPGSIDIELLAREMASNMGMLAAASGVRLHLCESTGPVCAMARATDVRQMLINLIANSITHAGAGSTVRIETGTRDDTIWLQVADDGAGIPQSVIDRLQQGLPLDADGAAVSRTRLGLTLTRSLVEANGGRIEIESSAAGTVVRVCLPAG
ncbi:MAG: sensor histidine kinase [Hyphomicrobiaceae bacterium]